MTLDPIDGTVRIHALDAEFCVVVHLPTGGMWMSPTGDAWTLVDQLIVNEGVWVRKNEPLNGSWF